MIVLDVVAVVTGYPREEGGDGFVLLLVSMLWFSMSPVVAHPQLFIVMRETLTWLVWVWGLLLFSSGHGLIGLQL